MKYTDGLKVTLIADFGNYKRGDVFIVSHSIGSNVCLKHPNTESHRIIVNENIIVPSLVYNSALYMVME